MAKRADTRYLRDVAYADPSGLAARTGLYDFQQPYIDLQPETLATLGSLDGRVVGDVGCGSGRYIGALSEAGARVVGIDLSVGTLEDAGLVNPRVTADDAQRLVATQFRDADVRWLCSSVIVTDPAPVVRHAASTTAVQAVGDRREELLDELTDAIAARIHREGQFTITTEVAFLTTTEK